MKKIAVITGTRAEFGLLTPLISSVNDEPNMILQLVACAMHLSPEFGFTLNDITDAGFKVDKKIECLLSSDSGVGVSKSIGLALISFAEAFEELNPDLIVILGDRSEMLAAATSATVANIPIAHIHGGETTEGAYDESFRHAITKMSFLHFASTESYRNRIIQLGESPERVFNVGAIGLDSMRELKLLDKKELEKELDFHFGEKNFLITYHPVTLENKTTQKQIDNILKACDKIENAKFIFTYANSDKEGRIINKMIDDYCQKNKNAKAFRSLGQLKYLSTLRFMDAIIGNSSSGIIEVPFFNIPSVNIGDRQKGRISSKSVIHTSTEFEDIVNAINKALNKDFKSSIRNQDKIYGNGKAAEKILDIIKSFKLVDLKKTFFDIKFNL